MCIRNYYIYMCVCVCPSPRPGTEKTAAVWSGHGSSCMEEMTLVEGGVVHQFVTETTQNHNSCLARGQSYFRCWRKLKRLLNYCSYCDDLLYTSTKIKIKFRLRFLRDKIKPTHQHWWFVSKMCNLKKKNIAIIKISAIIQKENPDINNHLILPKNKRIVPFLF